MKQFLKDILLQARKDARGLGHFNISNLEMLQGILEAAKEADAPVMIGTSENEAQFIGYRTAVAMARAAAEEHGVPVFLNADHHKSVEAAKAAIDAGYESVHIDLSRIPYEENITGTKEVVDYARASGHDVSVEGELGILATESSKLYEAEIVVRPDDLTSPDQAKDFVKRTGVDRFAPAVGNFHGISVKTEKKLDMERISAIRAVLPESVALVLHGGSGTSDDQLQEAIRRGVANVHISTELRVAYTEALRKSLADNPGETTPYKIFSPAVKAVKNVVGQKLTLFGWK